MKSSSYPQFHRALLLACAWSRWAMSDGAADTSTLRGSRSRSRSPSGATDGDNGAPARVVHIYMCRHGTTTWNLAKKWQGETDTELADVGIQQAQATADMLAKRLPRGVRCILTSDLKRARATAEIYAARLGCEVIVEPRLREPSLGRFEGMTKENIYTEYGDLFARLAQLDQSERLKTAYFDGLEAPFDTSSRAEAAASRAVAAALQSAGDGSKDSHPMPPAALLVTHSKVLEAVLATVFGKFYEGIETTPCGFFDWRYALDGRPHELGELHNIGFHDRVVEQ